MVIVPVPARSAVHPEFLDPRLRGGLSLSEASPYESLRATGVEVLDLAPDFADTKSRGALYCERDTHWNGSAIAIAAKKLAKMLPGTITKSLAFDTRENTVEIQGDLGGEKEKVKLRFVHHLARPSEWNQTAPALSSC